MAQAVLFMSSCARAVSDAVAAAGSFACGMAVKVQFSPSQRASCVKRLGARSSAYIMNDRDLLEFPLFRSACHFSKLALTALTS